MKTGTRERIDEKKRKRTPPRLDIRKAIVRALVTFAYLMMTPDIPNAIKSADAKHKLF
jgi:hypothetical protein